MGFEAVYIREGTLRRILAFGWKKPLPPRSRRCKFVSLLFKCLRETFVPLLSRVAALKPMHKHYKAQWRQRVMRDSAFTCYYLKMACVEHCDFWIWHEERFAEKDSEVGDRKCWVWSICWWGLIDSCTVVGFFIYSLIWFEKSATSWWGSFLLSLLSSAQIIQYRWL